MPNAQHPGNVMLALLARAGVTGSRAGEALHVLIVYTIGSASFTTRAPLATGEVPPPSGEDHSGHFDHGLRWVLAGISRSPQPGPIGVSDPPAKHPKSRKPIRS